MTRTGMEDAMDNRDRRLSAGEQMLPMLASKQDVHEAFDAAKRPAGMLIDDVRDDIRMIAKGVATLTTVHDNGGRVERRFESMDRRSTL